MKSSTPTPGPTPIKLEYEQMIENFLPELQKVIELVPESHRNQTRQIARSVIESMRSSSIPSHVAAPVLAMALDEILQAVLGRSRELRAEGLRHPLDPPESIS